MINNTNLFFNHEGEQVVRICYCNIQQLHMICSLLTPSALWDVVYALVLSRISYCNALYMNVPACELRQLQLQINTAAQIVSG